MKNDNVEYVMNDLIEWGHELLGRIRAVGGVDEAQFDAWEEHFAELMSAAERPVRVANAGLLKAGKSTLFNAIFGEAELFATGAARKTVVASAQALGQLELVDTPGVDAYEDDEAAAEQVLRAADMVLVVHSVTDGEFDRQELDFLEQLGRYFPEDDARRRALVAVFTKGEGVESKVLDAICDKAVEQWKQALGVEPARVFRVFSERHLKGLREQKSVFCERSGIPELVSFLEGSVDELAEARAQLVQARFDELVGDITDAVGRQIRQREAQLASITRDNQPKIELLRLDYATLAASVRESYQQL